MTDLERMAAEINAAGRINPRSYRAVYTCKWCRRTGGTGFFATADGGGVECTDMVSCINRQRKDAK